MKNLIYPILLFFAVTLMSGCSSGKKALEKGDYVKAVTEAVNHLKSNPKHKKASSVLIQSYPLAKAEALREIRNAQSANLPDKYSIAADRYLMLNRLADLIHSSPRALQLTGEPADYSKELGKVLPLAAEERYSRAEKLMKTGDIMDAREAYYEYRKANEYVDGYRDCRIRISEALDAATLKVIVEKPVTPARFQLSSDFFYDNLMSEMDRFSRNRFVSFHTSAEAGKPGLMNPDQYMLLDFEDFSVGNVYESTDRYEAKKDSVVIGRTRQDGHAEEVYGTVKADVVLHRQEVVSEGLLSVKILNSDHSRVVQSKRFPGSFVWGNSWLTFNGDERALNEEEYRLSKLGPVYPPSRQELFAEFTKPIFDQLTEFVRWYYSDF